MTVLNPLGAKPNPMRNDRRIHIWMMAKQELRENSKLTPAWGALFKERENFLRIVSF
jgi:hypothetical protein